MATVDLKEDKSVLIIVDVQPVLAGVLCESDRLLGRSLFTARSAAVLEIPVLATVQNQAKMGELLPELAEYLSIPAFDKMSFSAAGCPEFMAALLATGRKQVVIVGVETHICVCLTALDLLKDGFEVVVCPDGVTSRTMDRHKLGMERIRDAGVVPAHTESVVYEWMQTADHPKFRDVLKIVKSS